MKYSINNHVQAFTEALEKVSPEQAVERLVKLLKKTGDIKHSKKIIEAIHKKLVNKRGGKWMEIETARESASTKELTSKFSNKDHVKFKINPELVAGVRITVNGEEELDNTLANKLKKMFVM